MAPGRPAVRKDDITGTKRRIVTEAQLREGYTMLRSDGSLRSLFYADVQALPNGTIEVEDPEIGGGLYRGSDVFIPPQPSVSDRVEIKSRV